MLGERHHCLGYPVAAARGRGMPAEDSGGTAYLRLCAVEPAAVDGPRGEVTAARNSASSFFPAAEDAYALTGESDTVRRSTIRFAPRRTADVHPWADARYA